MTSEPYVPPKIGFVRAEMHLGDGAWKKLTETEFDRFIAKIKAEARAEGARETARYIERIAPKGLADRARVLADMEVAAERLERGMHANGIDRIEDEA